MIRRCVESDLETIYAIINDAAEAYHGVIPDNSWHEPYMSMSALSDEIQDGVVFWGAEQDGTLAGIMGIQEKGDVTLIRHAYVRTKAWRQGIGTNLLRHLEQATKNPILIGTWANATWAISFYQHNGYQVVSEESKDILLRKYWSISGIQIEASVVMANAKWISMNA